MNPLIVPFFISHRGCSHRCVFCNQATISGSDGTFPSTVEVVAKIDAYRRTAGGRPLEVAFYGGTFTALPRLVQQRLLHPLQSLLASGTVASVRVSTRPDAIDQDIAATLRDMGVGVVELGVQSMDDRVLENAGRGHTAADVAAACGVLHREGVAVGIQLMVGLPGDSPGGSLETLRRVLDLKPAFLRLYPTLVMAGTELAEMYRNGVYQPLTLDEAVGCCKVLLHEALRADVPVIRCGLQDTPALGKTGSCIAGPHHPAFRQLLDGALFYDLMVRLAGDVPVAEKLVLTCAASRVSAVAGQRRTNLQRLHRECGLRVAAIREESGFSPCELGMSAGNFVRKGNLVQDLTYRMEDICRGR